MEFNVKQRILMLGLLPESGSLINMRIVRELREALSFTEEDHKKYGIRTEGTAIVWNDATATKEIEIGDVARQLIVERLKALDEKEMLTEEHLAICDMFPEMEE